MWACVFPPFLDPYDPPEPEHEGEGDDFDHHDMCRDCRGSGKYIGFTHVSNCDTCDGSGWVGKGLGWSREKYREFNEKRAILERRGFLAPDYDSEV